MKINDALADAGGHHILTGKPTVAPNTGTGVNNRVLANFEPVKGPAAEWVRLPKPKTRCAYSGLSRTTLVELIERREVRSITLRQPGATRGIRLFHLPSLNAYIARLDFDQNGGGE
jgi:hypothetical protein